MNDLWYITPIILNGFFNNTVRKMRDLRLLVRSEKLLFVLLMWKRIFT